MITLLSLYFIVDHIINKETNRRWDGSPALPYYSASDFGVAESGFSFFSGRWRLYGSRYFLAGQTPKALVVFFHGIGAGRNAYMQLICDLAKQCYLVYAFDYTGSMQSEGPMIYGLGHPLQDLEYFFEFLSQDPLSKGLPRYVMGHSWGGYVAMMATQNKFSVDKCVSIAGFNSVSDLFVSLVPQLKHLPIRPLVKTQQAVQLGKYGNKDAVSVLKETRAKVLYVQGQKDIMVYPSAGGDILKRELVGRSNISFLDVPDRGHQCFLSKDSEDYLNSLIEQGIMSTKGPIGLAMDIRKASNEDAKVMQSIFHFFAS